MYMISHVPNLHRLVDLVLFDINNFIVLMGYQWHSKSYTYWIKSNMDVTFL